jgi:hypothetical protein
MNIVSEYLMYRESYRKVKEFNFKLRYLQCDDPYLSEDIKEILGLHHYDCLDVLPTLIQRAYNLGASSKKIKVSTEEINHIQELYDNKIKSS